MNASQIFSITFGVIGVVFAFVTWLRSSKSDTKLDGEEKGYQKGIIETLQAGLNNILVELKSMRRDNEVFNVRISKVEESNESAHKRIDELRDEMRATK